VPLPTDARTPWPLPGTVKKVLNEQAEHAVWFSGDARRLREFYAGTSRTNRPSQQARGLAQRARQFWGRRGSEDQPGSEKLQLHIPLAGDIATTSSDLLFSEAPKFQIPEAHGDAPEAPAPDTGVPTPDNATTAEAKKAQARLEEIIEDGGLHNVLLEAGEVSAAIGGVYLRPAWDASLVSRPLLTTVAAEKAVPEFRFGLLTSVTFFQELRRDATKVWRHLERHEPGVIFHGVYEGTDDQLGKVIPLAEFPETASLADALTDGNQITLDGWDKSFGLFVRYVPNMRPNRRWGGYTGRSDFQGIESIMDALDETYTSWIRDIRLGQARLVVPTDFLTGVPSQPQLGKGFNYDQEIFTPLDMDASQKDGNAITPVEFTIRTQQHAETARDLFERAVSNAGYSPQSFGLTGEGGAVTATEIRARERKSFKTKSKKEGYWRAQLEEILQIMLFIDGAVFNNGTPVMRPKIVFSDSIAESDRERAETVEIISRAQGASVETKVRMLHPDWPPEQVNEEVARVLAQSGAAVPDPFATGAVG
jgi:hypothetical protein